MRRAWGRKLHPLMLAVPLVQCRLERQVEALAADLAERGVQEKLQAKTGDEQRAASHSGEGSDGPGAGGYGHGEGRGIRTAGAAHRSTV